MAVGLSVGPIFYKVGTGGFLHCFFSNVAYHLEEGNWGSKFPFLMKKLYNEAIQATEIDQLEAELKAIREDFKEYHPNMAIWEIENPSTLPPWGNNIAARITSLSNYFVTSDGDDLFDLFFKATDAAKQVNMKLNIESL